MGYTPSQPDPDVADADEEAGQDPPSYGIHQNIQPMEGKVSN